MKKNDDRAFGWEWLAMLVMAVVVYACASRGYPEGGPKDTTPPQVILEEPASFTKNFDKKRVNIYFDEFVQLKDINEKFIISPPQKKKPKPRLKGKYVQVEFVDSLNKVLNGQVEKREAGYKVAESRSIDLVAHQLVEAYQTVLEM